VKYRCAECQRFVPSLTVDMAWLDEDGPTPEGTCRKCGTVKVEPQYRMALVDEEED
jgi:DNA-directed RNA polymerase subunit RPC12/RpoP